MQPDVDRFGLNAASVGIDADQMQRSSAFKTVASFAGITKRRLWLKDTEHAHTDGHEIGVPLAHPSAYQLLGHQLAHILFQTNPQARKLFIQEYGNRIYALVASNGTPLEENQKAVFTQLVRSILNSLECHRVESLWSLLYPGSYLHGRQEAREAAERLVEAKLDHVSFENFLSAIGAGVTPSSGQYDRFTSYVTEAFRKSERRGPNATLIVGKWLVSHLVAEILREARNEPPPEPSEQLPDLAGDALSEEGDPKPEQSDDPKPEGVESEPPSDPSQLPQAGADEEGESVGNSGMTPPEGAQAKESGDASGGTPTDQEPPPNADDGDGDGEGEGKLDPKSGPGSGKWSPPRTDASPKEKAEALKNLLDRLGQQGTPKTRFEDVKDPPTAERGAAQQATKMVTEALRADANDPDAFQKALDGARGAMDQALEAARNAFRQEMNHDEWIRKDANAKVVFRDVRARDIDNRRPPPLIAEDLITVQRLRAIFSRVMGRTKWQLEDDGTGVDVPAVIERRITQAGINVFQHDARGQGFKPLVLLDRSGSMGGEKQYQAERAGRIIARALRYPFVDLHIWGFQSLEGGQIDISRFDPKTEIFDTAKTSIGGVTPLHLAIRVALRFLERGTELKHLFAVTDGFPIYQRKDGTSYNTRQLILMAREEAQIARSRNIATTGVIIGNGYGDSVTYDLGPRELRFIFGSDRHWKQVHPQRLGADLVQLVAGSFVDYLKRI